MMGLVVLLHLLLIAGVAYGLYLGQRESPLRMHFLPGLVIKLIAGLVLGLIYTYYYRGGDTFLFFHDASVLAELAFRDPMGYLSALLGDVAPGELSQQLIYQERPRALFMAKLLSPLAIITYKNYWISSLYCSLFSFLGFFYLATVLSGIFPGRRTIAAIAFLYVPSAVFWSSGVMKEAVAMGAMTLMLALWCQYFLLGRRVPVWKIVASVLLGVVFFKLKYYYAAVLLPVVFALTLVLLLMKIRRLMPLWQQIFTFAGIFVVLLLVASQLHPVLDPQVFLVYLLDTHDKIKAASSAGPVVRFDRLSPHLGSLIVNAPKALFAGLFRPGMWEVSGWLQMLSGIENLCLFVATLVCLVRVRQTQQHNHGLLLAATLFYIIFLAVLMAFASPNLGTLVRYKIGFLPFLVFLLLSGWRMARKGD